MKLQKISLTIGLLFSSVCLADMSVTYTPYNSNRNIQMNNYPDSSYYGIGSSYEYYSPNSTIIIKDRVIPNYRPPVYYIERPRNQPQRYQNYIRYRRD